MKAGGRTAVVLVGSIVYAAAAFAAYAVIASTVWFWSGACDFNCDAFNARIAAEMLPLKIGLTTVFVVCFGAGIIWIRRASE